MMSSSKTLPPPLVLASEPSEPEVLGELIARMMSHVHRRSAGDTLAIMHKAGLTMAQLVALHALIHRGTQSVTAVARCLRLSAGATSHLVDRLVGDGLAARAENPTDRRQKCVSITAAGRRLVLQVQTERTRELAGVVARLTPGIRRQFGKIMLRVIGELSSLPQDGS
jgi:DNA-binding MarR family transcriptional regulator